MSSTQLTHFCAGHIQAHSGSIRPCLPLALAIRAGHTEVVRALLESRASPFVAYYGQVRIKHGCMHNRTGAARFSVHVSRSAHLGTKKCPLVSQAARVFDDWALHPAPRTAPGWSSVDLVSLSDTGTNRPCLYPHRRQRESAASPMCAVHAPCTPQQVTVPSPHASDQHS